MSKTSKNIILIGFMGSGKTTVGKILSQTLQRKLLDSDHAIEDHTKRSISDIFEKEGEKAFRDIETEVIKNISAQSGMIISCGGGSLERDENVKELKKNGIIIWLKPPFKVILSRIIHSSHRPLTKITEGNKTVEETLRKRYMDRYLTYQSAADIIINTGNRNIYSVVNEVVKRLAQKGVR